MVNVTSLKWGKSNTPSVFPRGCLLNSRFLWDTECFYKSEWISCCCPVLRKKKNLPQAHCWPSFLTIGKILKLFGREDFKIYYKYIQKIEWKCPKNLWYFINLEHSQENCWPICQDSCQILKFYGKQMESWMGKSLSKS